MKKLFHPRAFIKYNYTKNNTFKNQILDNKQDEIWKKIKNLKEKLLEAKYEDVVRLNAEVFDDYYEDLKETVEDLYDNYGKLKIENEQIQEVYKPKMLEIKKEMDNFWNVLYNSKYQKFNEAEEMTFDQIFKGTSKFWGK
eukprot:gene9689-1895_t